MATPFKSIVSVLDVLRGIHPNAEIKHIHGINADVDIAAAEDMWPFGGNYTFQAAAAAMFISSSDNDDDQVVKITYLDADYRERMVLETLNGQTQVALPASLTALRVNKFEIEDSTDPEGTVYVTHAVALSTGTPTDATKILSVIRFTDNIAHQCIYTVPENKQVSVLSIEGGKTGAVANVAFALRARELGSVFKRYDTTNLTTGGVGAQPSVAHVFPEKTDIIVRCESTSVDDSFVFSNMLLLEEMAESV